MAIPQSSPHVAALLFRRIGDTLLATPALRALKKGIPGCHLTVIAEPQVHRIFEGNQWIDDLVLSAKVNPFQLASSLRKNGIPDIVIDFLSDPRSALACYLSRAKTRIGFDYPYRRCLCTRRVPLQDPALPVYSAIHKLQLVSALGIASSDIQSDFHIAPLDIEFAETIWTENKWNDVSVVAFFVHSRREYKRWPLKYFAEVLDEIRRRPGIVPLVLSTPGDDASIETLRTLTHLGPGQVLELRDLGHLAAVLSKCAVLIGNDGGPKHLAVALKVPTITIFRDESPAYWTPPETTLHQVVAARPGQSLEDILASEVVALLENIPEMNVR